ncbi:Transcription factor bHLH35 [Linum perenne]
MEPFENIGEEFDNEVLDGWVMDEAFSCYYDSSSPDGTSSLRGTKQIREERNRRKKLHEQERRIQAEIVELESGGGKSSSFKKGWSMNCLCW